MDGQTVAITRTSSGLSITEGKEQHGPAQTHSQPFSVEDLQGRLDPSESTWVELPKNGKLFPLVAAYVCEHTTDRSSFTLEVSKSDGDNGCCHGGSRRNASAKPFDDAIPQTRLGLGLGLFSFEWTDPAGVGNDTEGGTGTRTQLFALHSAIGKPVGTDCGPKLHTSLVLFVPTGGGCEAVLQRFCDELLAASERTKANTYQVFRYHARHSYWSKQAVCRARPIDSVVMPASTKEPLLEDLADFLSEDTYEFYHEHGIPYKRSYLFHGQPGGGKTSLITALAGLHGRNVCFLCPSHPDMTDDALLSAVREVPARSIVVLEDIDALFGKGREKKIKNSPLTFSGLLNALDGIGNPNGTIFILTTNFRDQLDEALVRCGRVDLHVEFVPAGEEQMQHMFIKFKPDASEAQAKRFAVALKEALGDKRISMSSLQHFFVGQRKSSVEETIANIGAVLSDLQSKEETVQTSSNKAATLPDCEEEEEE